MNIELIEQLIESELKIVDAKWPDYHNHHEAYAVIKEEVEELGDCSILLHLSQYWQSIKNNDIDRMPVYLDALKIQAKEAIKEAVQVYVTACRAERLINNNK